MKVPLCPSPRTGLPNTSLPICACEIRNLSRLHKLWKQGGSCVHNQPQ
jgi:hypothetical protein